MRRCELKAWVSCCRETRRVYSWRRACVFNKGIAVSLHSWYCDELAEMSTARDIDEKVLQRPNLFKNGGFYCKIQSRKFTAYCGAAITGIASQLDSGSKSNPNPFLPFMKTYAILNPNSFHS